MATYAFPSIEPRQMTVQPASNEARYTSESSLAVQTVTRAGDFLILSMAFGNLKDADRAELIGFLVKLQGGKHRFSIHNYSENNRGAFGGTPVINGANQVGNSINVDGCDLSVTNWIRTGDFFQIGNELKICTDDASSDGSGEISINFGPRIRTSPGDGTTVVTSQGKGIFMLSDSGSLWTNEPGLLSNFTVNAIEDVRA